VIYKEKKVTFQGSGGWAVPAFGEVSCCVKRPLVRSLGQWCPLVRRKERTGSCLPFLFILVLGIELRALHTAIHSFIDFLLVEGLKW
jgi:hypothetical protein